jgi:hypothetical protein
LALRSDEGDIDIVDGLPTSSSSSPTIIENKDNLSLINTTNHHEHHDDAKRYSHNHSHSRDNDSSGVGDHSSDERSLSRRSASNADNGSITGASNTPSVSVPPSTTAQPQSAFNFSLPPQRHQRSNSRGTIATPLPLPPHPPPTSIPSSLSSTMSSSTDMIASHAMTSLLPVIQNQAQRTDTLIVNVDHVLGNIFHIVP